MTIQLSYATPTRISDPRWLAASCLMTAASLLAIGINIRDGEYWPSAIACVGAAILFAIVGALFEKVRDDGWGPTVVTIFTLGAIAAQLLVYEWSPPGGWNTWSDDLTRRSPIGLFIYYGGAWAAWLLVAIAMLVKRWRGAFIAAILTIHFFVGLWFISAAPNPRIDVFEFQQNGAEAFIHRANPYGLTFDNIYVDRGGGLKDSRRVYGQAVAKDGKLEFGFPYPPLSLFLSTAGYVVANDHRYAQLFAMTVSGLFIALMRSDRLSVIVAVLFLFMPRAFFVLGRGWTEPFVVMFLAATVLCAVRFRKLLPVALGLLLASKQYTAFIVPLAALLVGPSFSWRAYVSLIAKAVGVAAVVTLPLALWDLHAFWHSLVTVQRVAPFREDALSLLVWYYGQTDTELGPGLAFMAALMATVVALWRAPRAPWGFAASVGLVYLVFVALNKQAFANYYYFVIAAIWCALAAMPPANPLESQAPNVR